MPFLTILSTEIDLCTFACGICVVTRPTLNFGLLKTIKTSSHRKSSSKVDIKNEKGVSSASSEKAKKRDNLDGKQLAEVTVKEEISSPTFTGSLEGLSEVDIRTKLIESAKIRSKISRQSSDEKLKKKAKRNLSGQQQSEKSKSGKIIIVNNHHLNCSTNSQSDY